MLVSCVLGLIFRFCSLTNSPLSDSYPGVECGGDVNSKHSLSSQSGDNYTQNDTNGMSASIANHDAGENTAPLSVGLNKELMTTIKSTQLGCSKQKNVASVSNISGDSTNHSQAICDYCALTFGSESDLNVHCQTEAHQIVVMSDGGRDWR